ncbi:hypothetical protein [Mycoplasmopsis adleri]|uniref:hypothetical protein n=1 Tax=Mycoplasmopsis adleri TaxID=51362 RepID=UPI003872DBAF
MVRRTSTGVRDGLIYLMQKYNLTIDSLTIDNGSENAELDEVQVLSKYINVTHIVREKKALSKTATGY